VRRIAFILVLLCVLAAPIVAQDGYPLPPDLPVIEPDNAAQLTQLASIGGTLPGGLAWSPDGSQLAVGTSEDVQIYNADDWESTPNRLPIARSNYNILFTSDNNLSVNGKIWDVHSGDLIPPTPPSISLTPTRRYLSPDGSIEAIPDYQQDEVVVHLVDAQNNPLASLKTGLDADVSDIGLLFSPDGQKLLINLYLHDPDYEAYFSTVIQLWDISSGKQLLSSSRYGAFDRIVFSEDSLMLLVVVYDPTGESLVNHAEMNLWNTETGEIIKSKLISTFEDYVGSSKGMVAFRSYESIGLWTGQQYIDFESNDCYSESGNVAELSFSPSGSTLVTGVGCGEQILLWDVSGKIDATKPSVVLDSENLIKSLAFSPDETLIVTGEDGLVAKLWDAHNGVHLFDLAGEGAGVRFNADGTLLRGIDSQQNIILWKPTNGERLISLPHSALLNADWSQAVYWTDTTTVRAIETASGNATDLKIIDDYVGAISAFNAATSRVIFKNEGLQGYSLETGQIFFQQPDARVSQVQFSHSGDYFVTNSPSDDELPVWKIWQSDHPQQPLHTFEMPSLGNFILSNDGKWFSEPENCGTYRLWNATNGEQELYVNPGGLCGPYSHTFSTDEKWIIVGWDMSIDFINIAEAITEAAKNEGRFLNSESSFTLYFDSWVNQLLLSPDGEQLAVAVIPYSAGEPIGSQSPQIEIFSVDDLVTSDNFQEIKEIPHPTIANTERVSFSPDSRYVLSNYGLFYAATGDLLVRLSSATASFNPSGTILATSEGDELKLWDVAALVAGQAIPLATYDVSDVQQLAFNSAGTLLYVRRTGDIQVWATE
jgi:WD40 repeat protein